MRTIVTITLAALLLLGLAACNTDEAPLEPAAAPAIDAPKTDGMHGAQVVRYEDTLAIVYYDVARELQMIVGVDLEEYCTAGFYPDFVNIMEVTNPVDQDVVVQLIQGTDVHAAVYPLHAFDCGLFLSEGPIASGLVNFQYVDNDLYAWWETNDNPRVNSYITKVNGTLYTPDGGKVLLNYTWKIVWPGYPDFDQVRELVSDIRLAFTGS